MTPEPDATQLELLSAEMYQASQKLLQMVMGFRVSQMIYVASKLGIADLLKDGPQSADELAATTHAHAQSLHRLLRALASVGIFAEDEQGRFALTALAALLQTGVPGSQRARSLVFGDESRWRSWGSLLYSITTGEPSFKHLFNMDDWDYKAQHPDLNANFNDYMTGETRLDASAIVSAYDFSGTNTLVDVGGGHGTLISAILKANPHLHGILCDAPHVVSGAQPVLEAAGVLDRCELVPCDFFSSVPAGGDIYTLKWIIHDWADEQALAILKTCRRAIPEHGRLLLVEGIILPGNEPDLSKAMDLQMLIMFGGQERTAAEYGALLDKAGFKITRILPTTSKFSIVEAAPV